MKEILCDVCFTALKSDEEFEYCKECHDMLDRYCFCCDTVQAEPVDFICEECQKDMDHIQTRDVKMHSGCVINPNVTITKWEWPEL